MRMFFCFFSSYCYYFILRIFLFSRVSTAMFSRVHLHESTTTVWMTTRDLHQNLPAHQHRRCSFFERLARHESNSKRKTIVLIQSSIIGKTISLLKAHLAIPLKINGMDTRMRCSPPRSAQWPKLSSIIASSTQRAPLFCTRYTRRCAAYMKSHFINGKL